MTMGTVSVFSTKSLDALVAPGPVGDVGVIMLSPLARRRCLRCARNPPWFNFFLGFACTCYATEPGTTRVPRDNRIINGENRWAYGSAVSASD